VSWPSYPICKPSGIDWIGEVPKHWSVRRLTQLATLESGHTPSRNVPAYWENCTIPWVSLSDAHQFRDTYLRSIQVTEEKISELGMRNSAARLLPPETVILSRTASVGFAVKLGRSMATTQDFANWICGPQLDPDFLLSCFWGMKGEFERLRYGSTHNTIYMPDIRSFVVPHPPLDEQKQIAIFLDRELAKTCDLLGKQRRLIELLKEKRQAVIARTVTKGLQSNVPMKPSGIDWIGDIPAHWEVRRITQLARLESGHTPSRNHPEYWVNCAIPWVTLGDVHQFRDNYVLEITETGEAISEIGLQNSAARLLPEGTVILSRTASVGYAVKLGRAMATTQDFVNWVCGPELVPDYLLACFWSMKGEFERLKYGSTHNTIYMPDVRSLIIPRPPQGEQSAISLHIISCVSRMGAAIQRVEKAVTLLDERRKSLIAAVVTGKIDVRVPPLTVSLSDRVRLRVLVAAEITHRHHGLPRFGRVKLQKLLYLAEAHAGIHELNGNYFREAAGPLDSGMITDAERGMTSSEYFTTQHGKGNGVSYSPLAKSGQHKSELAGILGSRGIALARTIELIRDLETRSAEVIATIYAVWNDALLDGETPDDDRIVQAFLYDWRPEKRQKFKEADVRHWLDWMKRNGIVPAGTGPKTISTVPRDMFTS
jgi:restriction endonuclease S subunit